ncbi:MAG: polyribonucleotide nucleotidyltransferase [Alphaproteobacteria bacterium]|nr:polyribonucleotide nucleotidyltransferase [Alphaproteobacteria bacterium]
MFKLYKKEINFAGKTLTLETGKIARQADGAVLATMGETSVLCCVTGSKTVREGQDFFPLSVHYQEKTYAAGKIPGGFFKREARPSEKETLTSRLIDRPIRPLFPKGFLNEVQVVATVLSHDLENDPDMVAMAGCAAALTISGIPFMGPIAGARVGYKNGEYIVNPDMSDVNDMDLNLIVAGTSQGVLMVESEASELSEEVMLGAVSAGHEAYQSVINGVIDLAEMCAKDMWDIVETPENIVKMAEDLKGKYVADVEKAYAITDKRERQDALSTIRNAAIEAFLDKENGITESVITSKFKSLEADIVRSSILKTGKRIDQRDTKTVRPIVAEVGALPRTHGSALFTRGETQALVVTTLGTGDDEQMIDSLHGEFKETFMLHYNFPPYSVGETGRMFGAGRREIGHGALAERAIKPSLPEQGDFPYTIRIVSEVLESNGSSSMATVCGGSLAMMDAGVPLKAPCAGVAMGLIKEGEQVAVLTDILGAEDHLGDMDFKIAGTREGVTAIQMDIKIGGLSHEILRDALGRARDARLHILDVMAQTLESERSELSKYAPRIITIQIDPEKIGDIIGPKGKIIRGIQDETGAEVNVDDSGLVTVSSVDGDAGERARQIIEGIVKDPEVGQVYEGTVKSTTAFGAFVEILPGKEGLLHISELQHKRTEKTEDVVKKGETVRVKLLEIDDRGKMRLSRKALMEKTETAKT